jgi:hypothetical protein
VALTVREGCGAHFGRHLVSGSGICDHLSDICGTEYAEVIGVNKLRIGFLFVVLATACTDQRVGSGPITFSPRVQAGYDEYRSTPGPGAFVVNQSGQAFSTACASTECRGGAISQALQMCRKADGGECYIYDIGGQVVWRRDVPAPAAALRATEPLIHCLLRGSDILTTRKACASEGGTLIDA